MNLTASRIVGNLTSMILDEPIKMIRNTISGLMWFTVDVSTFRWNVKQDAIVKYFPHIPTELGTEMPWYDDESTIVNRRHFRSVDYAKIPGKRVDACMFEGTTIWLEFECNPRDNNSDGNYRLTMSLKVVYTKKNVETLRKFIRQIIKESKKIEAYESKFIYRKVIGNYSSEYPDKPNRSFDNVFIPLSQEQQIITGVKKFCDSEAWYRKHCIPYHYGIMLHGNPGTGKSSVVQAIINLIDCDVYYIPGDKLSEAVVNEEWLRFAPKDRMRVVVIEDLDTCRFTLERSTDKDENAFRNVQIATIGTFLNMIDGFGNNDKVIYIFTTNHLEKLDPAIIRPGRVDLCLEIDYINEETFKKFCQFHYQTEPEHINVRDKLTFAELQVKVMEGYTLEQLCEYVKKKEDSNV